MKKLTAKLVETRLRKHDGNLAAVARASGVTRSAVDDYIRRRPALQQITRECRESMKDNAESTLYRAVIAGEAWAVCFFLKTQARDRGYVEKTILAGDPNSPLVHRLIDKEYEVGSNGFDPDGA